MKIIYRSISVFIISFLFISQIICQDTIPPVAKCFIGIPTIVMPENRNYISLPANYFDHNSFDSVTSVENLRYSYSEDITEVIKPFCYEGMEEVTIYVWDEANNFSTCKSKIKLDYEFNTVEPCCECYGDTLKPLVICKNLSAEISVNGYFEFSRYLLVDSLYDNIKATLYPPGCIGFERLTCNDLGENQISIVAYDGNYNTDTCIAIISLSDPNNYCNTASSINYHPEIDLKFHPNPADLETHVLNADQFNKIQLINLNGDVICKFEKPCKNLLINTSRITNGIYFIQGINENALTANKKVIINH